MPTAPFRVPTAARALAVLTHVVGALGAGAEASDGALEPYIGGHRRRWRLTRDAVLWRRPRAMAALRCTCELRWLGRILRPFEGLLVSVETPVPFPTAALDAAAGAARGLFASPCVTLVDQM